MVVSNASDGEFIDFENYESMAELSEQDFSPRRYQRGEVVAGEVVRVDDDGVVVSIGLKTEGMVPPSEMRTLTPEERENLQSGDSVVVVIRSMRGPGDMALLSIDAAASQRGWVELRRSRDSGEPITARITELNRGGLVVNYHGIRGFIPFSQLAPLPADTRQQILEERIGQDYPFNVLELDQRRSRVVLTERPLWLKEQDAERVKFLEQLEVGGRIVGRVTSMRDFGAFISLGQAEGLVHISELAWGRVRDPKEVVEVGQELEVQVIKVDMENRRVSLSRKRTLPEPWETVGERYSAGQIVDGVITRITDFGAFVRLDDWVEGLVHISELSDRQIKDPKECVRVNQEVRVMILSVDPAKRRIGLSYKKALEKE